MNFVISSTYQVSTISWSRPPVLLWDILDLQQVTQSPGGLLVGLPFVVIAIRVLDAFLRAVFHRFHLLQFRESADDRDRVLLSALFRRRCCSCCSGGGCCCCHGRSSS